MNYALIGWCVIATLLAIAACFVCVRLMRICNDAIEYCEGASRLLVEADRLLLEASGEQDINKRIRWWMQEQVQSAARRLQRP